MGADLTRLIAEVFDAAGRGAESMRRLGTPIVLEDCSIEVVIDEQPAPSAHVRLTFGTETRSEGRP